MKRTVGAVLHAPRAYDLMVRLAFMGRERPFRERLLTLAELQPGEVVLDIGCGTGSLAILASRRVGATGCVAGIDASAQMIAQACRKAARAGVGVSFQQAPAQALPFPDGQFDLVLSTLMLHHLPKSARAQLAGEARRVLRPGGRLLAVDFARSTRGRLQWHLRLRHGSVDPGELNACLTGAGLRVVADGPVGVKSLHFALAVAPSRA